MIIFLSFNCVYLSLNWLSFTWNKKIPIKFPGLSFISWKNYTISEAGEQWTRRDSNTQSSKTRAIRLYLCVFFLPAIIFCVLKLLIYPWNEVLLLEKQIPRKFPVFFSKLLKKQLDSSVGGNWPRRDSNTQPGVRRATVAPRSPAKSQAVRLKYRVFFPSSIHFLSFKYVYLSLNWRSFTWNQKKSRSGEQALSLISWKNYTNSNSSGYLLRRDSNPQPSDLESDPLPLRNEVLQRIEPYG